MTRTPTTLSIFGVTGTIGHNTLSVIAAHPDRFAVDVVTANENVEALAEAAKACAAKLAVIRNADKYSVLKEALAGSDIEVAAGEEALLEAASHEVDICLMAIVGIAALPAALTALKHSRRMAIANKECLVAAGDLFMHAANHSGCEIIPVDSEHNAVFQLLHDAHRPALERVVLTASGGPFRTFSMEQMQHITPAQAVKHPNWTMGAKISVDSATLMNKGLELIEAKILFGLESSQLDAIIHPESVIHCLLHYADGSVLSQLSCPDMRTPIAVALGWPKRLQTPAPKLDLAEIGTLHFEAVDETRFPCLTLAKQAMLAGGAAPTILNAANEVAVQAFLEGQIGFLQIAQLVETALQNTKASAPTTVEEVFLLDEQTRQSVRQRIQTTI